MNKIYLGIDCGRYSMKGIIIDEYDNILYSYYYPVDEGIILSIKKMISDLKRDIDFNKYMIKNVGVTGVNRKIVGIIFKSKIIRNEIVAYEYYLNKYKIDVDKIVDLDYGGGKVLYYKNKRIVDYIVNNNCNMITGNYLYMMSNKLKVDIDKSIYNDIINRKCMVYVDEDINKYISMGYNKEYLMGGLCKIYVDSIKDLVGRYNKILLVGGLSKYKNIYKYFDNSIIIKNRIFIGALGIGLMARDYECEYIFDKMIEENDYYINHDNCLGCTNGCVVTNIYLNDNIIDSWGYRCKKGELVEKKNNII